MAHTTDTSVALTIPITKATEDAQGNLYVEGVATNDALDLDEQIIDKDFARSGLTKWFADWGNVRQMHSTTGLPPAGKAVDFDPNHPNGIWVKTLVVEPTAKELVKSGVYQAYSVGVSKPRIIRDQVAKGGRVVDGVFSEISLVDFPANPTCKFMLAKRAGTGDPEVVEKVTPADLAKLASLNSHPDAKASATWYALFKRDMDPNVGGGVDRDKIPDEDFAGEHRSFPIVTPGDVSDAADSIGRAKGQDPDKIKRRIIAIAHRKGQSFVDELPESWKSKEKAPEVDLTKADMKECPTCDGSGKIRDGHVTCPDCHGSGKMSEKTGEPDVVKGDTDSTPAGDAQRGIAEHPEPDGDESGPDIDDDGDGMTKVAYHLGRLHDATCAAFTDTDVLTAHPAAARGVPALVDAAVFAGQVSKALTDDAGTGTRIYEIPALSTAYGFAVQLKAADPELLEAAMAEVRKAFADMYPDAHPSPTNMRPGEFKRPYVSAGRAPLSAPGSHKPRIPLASHVPSAGDFGRGLITDGHEAGSPGDKPSGKAGEPELRKDRTFYTNAAKEQGSNLLTDMHDYIAGQHPGVCPMAGPTPTGEHAVSGSQGSSLTMSAAASTTLTNMQATAVPQPVDPAQAVHAAGEPDLTKTGPIVDPDTLKRLIREVLTEDEEIGTMKTDVATLTKSVEELKAQPDPASAAVRGPAALVKSQTPAGRGDDEIGDAAGHLVRLVKQARHPDSGVSVLAYEKLIKAIGSDKTAELIG